jgi:hypothetical protein
LRRQVLSVLEAGAVPVCAAPIEGMVSLPVFADHALAADMVAALSDERSWSNTRALLLEEATCAHDPGAAAEALKAALQEAASTPRAAIAHDGSPAMEDLAERLAKAIHAARGMRVRVDAPERVDRPESHDDDVMVWLGSTARWAEPRLGRVELAWCAAADKPAKSAFDTVFVWDNEDAGLSLQPPLRAGELDAVARTLMETAFKHLDRLLSAPSDPPLADRAGAEPDWSGVPDETAQFGLRMNAHKASLKRRSTECGTSRDDNHAAA